MSIEINNPCESVTSKDIDTFERQYRVTLPSSYRRFVLQNNGGKPVKKNTIQFFNRQFEEMEAFIIYRFLCIGPETYSINNYIVTYGNRIPRDLLPIAIGVGSGLICIGHKENSGKIYYWDPNFESGTMNNPTYENVYNISDSLDDMFSKLITEDEINDTSLDELI